MGKANLMAKPLAGARLRARWNELRNWWRPVLLLMRRELKDQLRDWRILFPLVGFTAFFPLLMLFTARRMAAFVEQYGAEILAERLYPFLILVVGFFPLTISLVVALESFAGERERGTIEPLLLLPVEDAQLYFGKLLSMLVLPLLASYAGIAAYLGIMAWRIHWFPEPMLLLMVWVLTTVQAFVMISAAVMISTQATSVRAANLLATAIVVPVALLLQSESMLMFWRRYTALWYYVAGLLLTAVLMTRVGLAHFNRENLLGRDLDVLTLAWFKRTFRRAFWGNARGLGDWYRTQVLPELRTLARPFGFAVLLFVLAFVLGHRVTTAQLERIPPEVIQQYTQGKGLARIAALQSWISLAQGQQGLGMVAALFLHNLRALVLAAFLGFFTFGVAGLLIAMMPIALWGAMSALAAYVEMPSLLPLILPHGVVEIPAILLFAASLLHLGAYWATPTREKTLGTVWLEGVARWLKVFVGVVLPLFLLAAVLEVYLTPRVALLFMGK